LKPFLSFLGKDSTPDDGIYTGVLLPHQFAGDGYYSIQVCLWKYSWSEL